jgi:putative ABC transport system permease protein
MDSLLQDLRYGFRMLLRNPAFAAVAIITLALGIGANTAIFSVVNATMLEPLPFPNRDRLVMIWEHSYRNGRERNVVSPGNFLRWRERARSLRNMAMISKIEVNVTGKGEPERVASANVSPALFTITGIRPLVGRTFVPDEEKPGNEHVALLSESYWRSHFGGDPKVTDQDVSLDGTQYRIVGVLPESAQLAIWGGIVEEPAPIWTPFAVTDPLRNWRGRYVNVLGELSPGVSVKQADAEMKTIAQQLEKERPEADTGWTTKVESLRDYLVGDIRPALLALLTGVGLVLLIAVVNVANLLLVRAAAREREVAVRFALGVTRWRLLRQLLTESILLAVIGGAVGLVLAHWGLQVLMAMAPSELPAITSISIDSRVLVFSIILALLTGAVFGAVPAFRLSAVSLNESLKSEAHASPARGRRRIRNVLAAAEAALAVMLLVGAGLMIRSFINLVHVDTGFKPENLVTLQLSLPDSKYHEEQRQAAFFQDLVDRVQHLPGVQAAGVTSFVPLTSLGSATDFTIDERPKPGPGEEPDSQVRSVTPGFFQAMSIPFVQGRTFGSQDKAEDAIKKVIINETLANMYWPNENPIGKRISMEWGAMLHAEVIGVVKDVKLVSLEEPPAAQMYWYTPQFPYSAMALVVKTAMAPSSLIPALRAQVAAIDPDLPIAKIQTAKQILSTATQSRRFTMSLMTLFAGVALTLAAGGLYGVISYSVAQRTQEIGVRMALGARISDVLAMVLREGLAVTATGVAVGIVAALVLVQLLQKLLFGVAAHDAITFTVVAAILLAVGVLASLVPARRASKIDPMVALRYE